MKVLRWQDDPDEPGVYDFDIEKGHKVDHIYVDDEMVYCPETGECQGQNCGDS